MIRRRVSRGVSYWSVIEGNKKNWEIVRILPSGKIRVSTRQFVLCNSRAEARAWLEEHKKDYELDA
jgi:hypothetical protein